MADVPLEYITDDNDEPFNWNENVAPHRQFQPTRRATVLQGRFSARTDLGLQTVLRSDVTLLSDGAV